MWVWRINTRGVCYIYAYFDKLSTLLITEKFISEKKMSTAAVLANVPISIDDNTIDSNTKEIN